MANPNVVAVSSIYANTVLDADVAASAVSLLTAASDKLLKVNSLVIANIDGTNAADISVWITRSSVDYYIAKTLSVAADSFLTISKASLSPASAVVTLPLTFWFSVD